MIFDVVASRQRSYELKVRPLVEDFDRRPCAASLAALAGTGPGTGLSLMDSEPATIQHVAAGLAQYCRERCKDDDEGVKQWAEETEPVRLAPRLDTYAGTAGGIGVALFVYLRMRAGADAVKPDGRLRQRLNRLGFDVPKGDAALILIAEAAAKDLGVQRLELDQLLWPPLPAGWHTSPGTR
jgi:hypothetical protein